MEASHSHKREKAVGNMRQSSLTELDASQWYIMVISDTILAQVETYVLTLICKMTVSDEVLKKLTAFFNWLLIISMRCLLLLDPFFLITFALFQIYN